MARAASLARQGAPFIDGCGPTGTAKSSFGPRATAFDRGRCQQRVVPGHTLAGDERRLCVRYLTFTLGPPQQAKQRSPARVRRTAAVGHEQPVVAFSQFAPEQSLRLRGVLDRSGMIHVSNVIDSQALDTARTSCQTARRRAKATAEGRPGAYCADRSKPGVYVGAAQVR